MYCILPADATVDICQFEVRFPVLLLERPQPAWMFSYSPACTHFSLLSNKEHAFCSPWYLYSPVLCSRQPKTAAAYLGRDPSVFAEDSYMTNYLAHSHPTSSLLPLVFAQLSSCKGQSRVHPRLGETRDDKRACGERIIDAGSVAVAQTDGCSPLTHKTAHARRQLRPAS